MTVTVSYKEHLQGESFLCAEEQGCRADLAEENGLDSISYVKVEHYLLISRPTQLPSLSEHEGIIPSPEPSVLSSHGSSVTRPASRHSTPSTPLQTEPLELWLESRVTSSSIEETTNHNSFDVYIDEVRFIPDNATIIKVPMIEKRLLVILFTKDKGNILRWNHDALLNLRYICLIK